MTEPLSLTPALLTPAHRRFIMIETIVGAVMSGAVPAILIALLKGPGRVPLFGPDSLATALIGGTLLPAFGMPIILSLVIRARARRGNAPALGWPVAGVGLLRYLPRPLWLRGVVMAMAMMLVLPAPGLAALALAHVDTLSRGQFILYNFAHGALIGLMLSPLVVIAALADPARRKVVNA